MSYNDRLRRMKYTSPSGAEFFLDVDSVTRSGGKKSPDNESPGQDGGPIQDLGNKKVSYPITCYIHGQDYDLEADRFWAALAEPGFAKIEHPRWGNITGLPINRTQTDGLVEGMGQSDITFSFIESSAELFEYPTVTTDTAAATQATVDDAASTITEVADESTDDPGVLASIKSWILSTLSPIVDAYDNITEISNAIREDITQAVTDIQSKIDDLVEDTETLAQDMLYLYRLPARVETSVQQKIKACLTIYNTIRTTVVDTTIHYGSWFGIVATGTLAGAVVAAAETTTAGSVETRDQAGDVILDLSAILALLRADVEAIESTQDFTADVNLLSSVEKAVSSAINGLIARALDLPSEQTMTLDREVTPLQLAYELYGDLDDYDTFEKFNAFTDDELIMIPRGREVRWYV